MTNHWWYWDIEHSRLNVGSLQMMSLCWPTVEKICRSESIGVKLLTPQAIGCFTSYSWPGNVHHARAQADDALREGPQIWNRSLPAWLTNIEAVSCQRSAFGTADAAERKLPSECCQPMADRQNADR